MYVSVTYEPTADQLRFEAWRRWRRRLRGFLWAVSALTLVSGSVMTAAAPNEPGVLKGVLVGVGLDLPVLLSVSGPKNVPKPARLRRPTQVTFTDERFAMASEYESVDLAWSEFDHLAETDGHFLLHLATGEVRIVPKRCWNAQQIDEVSAFLAERGSGTIPGAD